MSLAGPCRLGIALDDGRLVTSHPAVLILACRWGFEPWFLSFLSVTNLGELLLSAVSIYLWLACVGPRALHSLGVAFPFISCGVFYPHLQFGSVSLRSDLGFVSFVPKPWISFFWLGFQFRWVSCVGLTCPSPGVSLSIDSVNSIGYTVVVRAIARLFSQILSVLH